MKKCSKQEIRWTPRRDPYERAVAAFSASFMSDAKWRKALGAIADAGLGLRWATWKFIDEDRLYDWGVPTRRDLLPTGLADGRFQPEEYRWIEWIRFPRSGPPTGDGDPVAQDLDGLKRVLAAIGHFRIEEDERGLTLFGYGR
ncbi:hypothetical protein TA3x_005489 [Tundrisphaera sp. TA3]|uniref:hypothetical protein n=1 Tax=Tundrisphaera sp. TA3 TaxID=3435775 RepID=UPI003EBBE3C5